VPNGTVKVLAVEDWAVQRQLLVEVMTSLGHELHLAATGSVAEEKLNQNEYDLIITDLDLPDISGYRVIQTAEEKHPDVPVIVVTGCDIRTEPQRFNDNVRKVILKPYSVNELKHTIAASVEQSRQAEVETEN